MSQQSSPTPDPVAWMVVDKDGDDVDVHRDSEVAEASRIGWDDERPQYSPYRLVPLFRQPSALPATTPSDTLEDAIERVVAEERALAVELYLQRRGDSSDRWVAAQESEVAEARRALKCLMAGISPSEGSAPDTPALADHIAREMMWKGHGCGLYSDDGEMRCQCPVDWKRDSLPALHEHFRAKQLARALAPVPPSAPDTKPDEQAEIAALRAEREAMRHVIAWLLGEEDEFPTAPDELHALLEDARQYNLDRGVPVWRPRIYWWRSELRDRWAAAISVGPDNPANLRASSPPEGEDTQRMDWLERDGGLRLTYAAGGWRYLKSRVSRQYVLCNSLREAIDSARAAIPPKESTEENR